MKAEDKDIEMKRFVEGKTQAERLARTLGVNRQAAGPRRLGLLHDRAAPVRQMGMIEQGRIAAGAAADFG